MKERRSYFKKKDRTVSSSAKEDAEGSEVWNLLKLIHHIQYIYIYSSIRIIKHVWILGGFGRFKHVNRSIDRNGVEGDLEVGPQHHGRNDQLLGRMTGSLPRPERGRPSEPISRMEGSRRKFSNERIFARVEIRFARTTP